MKFLSNKLALDSGKIYSVFLCALFLFFFSVSSVAKPTTHERLMPDKKIEKVISTFGQNLNIGILVQDVNTGKILYQKNADRYFMPASNEKLFTAFAAFNYLGIHFTYQTHLFADLSKLEKGILKDNIYIQFSGDPTLTFEKLDHLIGALSQKGISRINGKIIIDDSAFDQTFESPGTSWDDKDFYFGAPISALILDRNCVTATIIPAAQPQQPAHIKFPAQPQSMYFTNRVTTVAPNAPECKLEVTAVNETTYQISGCVKTTDSPKDIIMAIHDPRKNIQFMISYLLKKYQITVSSPIEFQKITVPTKLLASETSQPLPTLINQMLKESDNTIANTLFKTMGERYAHQPGSWENGSEAVHHILHQALGLTIPQNILIDGAGSSRYNYLTPYQISTLLNKAYSSNYSASFISALPIAGVDGTLKDRLTAPGTRGKIRAKTGTMTAVTALSGYLETQKKHTLIFSILINGFIDSPLQYQKLEDQICTALIKE